MAPGTEHERAEIANRYPCVEGLVNAYNVLAETDANFVIGWLEAQGQGWKAGVVRQLAAASGMKICGTQPQR